MCLKTEFLCSGDTDGDTGIWDTTAAVSRPFSALTIRREEMPLSATVDGCFAFQLSSFREAYLR